MPIGRHGLQAKCILACGNHIQGYRVAVPAGVHMLGFEPRAKARIEDLGLSLPEIGREPALDPEVIQLQFNGGDILGKIPPDIICTDEQSRESPSFTLCFDYHMAPALQRGDVIQFRESGNGKAACRRREPACGPLLERIDLESQSGNVLLFWPCQLPIPAGHSFFEL